MHPTYFPTAAAFREWLDRHHATRDVLWVGLYKKHAKQKGMVYDEAVDEALCFGWIDGQSNRVDDDRWMIRFTPRTATSIWSGVNLAKFEKLDAEGRVTPAGRAVYEARNRERSGIYSYERDSIPDFSREQIARFRKARNAYAFFTAQAPSYQRTARHWVMSAKKEETRERRLDQLIASSAQKTWLSSFTPMSKRPRKDR
ncbi:MAG: YdeI/OmpD-associated family protein [Longimicrobiales bacterium]